jgi:hypothetical protein
MTNYRPIVGFNPLSADPGTFRVCICLSSLGSAAWEVLQLSQTLGFEPPEFVSYKGESWAIVLNQKYDFDANSEAIVAPWDEKLQQLWQAADGNLMINTQFQDCLVAG